MDSSNRGHALGHRQTIWIKHAPRSILVPWGAFMGVRVQIIVPGFTLRPSGAKSRVRVHLPGGHLRLYP